MIELEVARRRRNWWQRNNIPVLCFIAWMALCWIVIIGLQREWWGSIVTTVPQ